MKFYYDSNLKLDEFSHMLDDPTECYKFYWLDAILTFVEAGETIISFSDIFDEMIADAWFSVSEHHLHLGPKSFNGNVKNSIERAVLVLREIHENVEFDTKEKVLQYILKINESLLLPYIIEDGRGLSKKIVINSEWKKISLIIWLFLSTG